MDGIVLRIKSTENGWSVRFLFAELLIIALLELKLSAFSNPRIKSTARCNAFPNERKSGEKRRLQQRYLASYATGCHEQLKFTVPATINTDNVILATRSRINSAFKR